MLRRLIVVVVSAPAVLHEALAISHFPHFSGNFAVFLRHISFCLADIPETAKRL